VNISVLIVAARAGPSCHLLLDPDVPDESLRKKVFAKIPRAAHTVAQLERFAILGLHQLIVLKSVRRVLRCPLECILRRRLAGLKP
jgi:hypothetical protein